MRERRTGIKFKFLTIFVSCTTLKRRQLKENNKGEKNVLSGNGLVLSHFLAFSDLAKSLGKKAEFFIARSLPYFSVMPPAGEN